MKRPVSIHQWKKVLLIATVKALLLKVRIPSKVTHFIRGLSHQTRKKRRRRQKRRNNRNWCV